MAGRIDAEELAALLAVRPRGIALFDIREAGEAELGHIGGATFLPRRLLELRIDELVPARATPIVVYDDGVPDGRADLATETLAAFGYRDTRILSGGLAAWRAMGRPLATGVNVPSKRFGEEVLEHDGVPSIGAAELARMQEAGEAFAQWDVRTPAEFARATVPGSLNVPGGELARHAEATAAEGRPVVVHCAGRTRSIIAARTLALLGVERVVALENGTMGWRLSGRSLAPGAAKPPPATLSPVGRGRVGEADRVRGKDLSGERAAPSPCPLPTGERVPVRTTAPNAIISPVAGTESEAALRLAEVAGVERLSAEDVAAVLGRRGSEPVIVVDVRDEAAHLSARVPHSCSRPGGQLVQCTDEVLAVEAARIVLVDDGDGRASVAGYWLRRMGFPRVGVLAGGLPAWMAARHPVERGAMSRPDWLLVLREATPAIAPAELDGSRVLLDVGTSRDFKAGHLPGARWLPRGWLEARLGDVVPEDAVIVVAAADEDQAVLAAATLRRLGRDALWLRGGNGGWTASGRALARTGTLPLDLPPDVVDPPYLKGEAGMRAYLEWEVALTDPAPTQLR